MLPLPTHSSSFARISHSDDSMTMAISETTGYFTGVVHFFYGSVISLVISLGLYITHLFLWGFVGSYNCYNSGHAGILPGRFL